jgi:glycosyltransferase involved in cell wall biosynthesis
MTKNIRILEICPFSAGVCGVWARVRQEANEFIKLGFDVRIFSSNQVKGDESKIACSEEEIEGIKIKRFSSNAGFFDRLISRNVTYFNFKKEFEEYNPDIVITHLLHPHSFKAVDLCNQNNIPCYLVTHAPFNVKRRFPLNLLTLIYNNLNIKSKINKFTKIISITKWELPYLADLGVKKDKIQYIPNGIPSEFFKQKKIKTTKDVLFLGRIAPVKDIETLVRAAKLLPQIHFSVVGSYEKEYLDKINKMIVGENINNIKILAPIYDLSKKIKLIDEHKIFVLPSLREAMPQVILEAMARGKIVLSSRTDGASEIIKDGKTGLLFNIGDYEQLSKLIKKNIEGNNKISSQAQIEAKKYSWAKLIKLYPFVK